MPKTNPKPGKAGIITYGPINPKKFKPGCKAYDKDAAKCVNCERTSSVVPGVDWHAYLCATSMCYQPEPIPEKETRYYVELEVSEEAYTYIASGAPIELWGLACGGEGFRLQIVKKHSYCKLRTEEVPVD